MSRKLFQAREQHPGAYAIMLPDGNVVPWRPLTVQEHLEYTEQLSRGGYPEAVIEDEIFSKCVLDSYLVENRGTLKAGSVAFVVAAILSVSGPVTQEEVYTYQHIGRLASEDLVHDLVGHITTAFPAYKPEDLYNMDYETFFLRLAQAERKLAKLGIITEPISIIFDDGEEQPQAKPSIPLDRIKETFDSSRRPQSAPRPTPLPDQETVIQRADMMEGNLAYSGHEREDSVILEHKMVESAREIYSDYTQALEDGGQPVIKTPEERLAEFEKQRQINEEKYRKLVKIRAQQEKKLMQEVEEAKKQRKSPKRRRRR